MAQFKYAPMFQLGEDKTEYYRIPGSEKLVKTSKFGDKTILEVSPEALTLVAQQSFHDCEFMLRRAHNEQVAVILNDPEASENDKYVALQFLRNAEVSVKGLIWTSSTRARTSSTEKVLGFSCPQVMMSGWLSLSAFLQAGHLPQASGSSPRPVHCSVCAKARARVRFPIPASPAIRYACEILPDLTAL